MREVSRICVSFWRAWIHVLHFVSDLRIFIHLKWDSKTLKNKVNLRNPQKKWLRYTIFFLGGIDHIQRCKGALQMYKTSTRAFQTLKEGVCTKNSPLAFHTPKEGMCTKFLHLLSTHQKKACVQNFSICFQQTKRRFMYKMSPLAFHTLKEGVCYLSYIIWNNTQID
jgi:hypothetical protein